MQFHHQSAAVCSARLYITGQSAASRIELPVEILYTLRVGLMYVEILGVADA